MARLRESDLPPSLPSTVRLYIYRAQIRPSERDNVAYQVSDLISQDISTVNTACDWLIANSGGYGRPKYKPNTPQYTLLK